MQTEYRNGTPNYSDEHYNRRLEEIKQLNFYGNKKLITKRLVKFGHSKIGFDSRKKSILNDLGYYKPKLINLKEVKVFEAYYHEQKLLKKTENKRQKLFNMKGSNPVLYSVIDDYSFLTEYRNIPFDKAYSMLMDEVKRENNKSKECCYIAQYELSAPLECFPNLVLNENYDNLDIDSEINRIMDDSDSEYEYPSDYDTDKDEDL